MFKKRAGLFAMSLVAVSTLNASCSKPCHRQFAVANLSVAEKDCYDAISAAHAQEEAAVSRKDIDGAMAEMSPDSVTILPDRRKAGSAEARKNMLQLF